MGRGRPSYGCVWMLLVCAVPGTGAASEQGCPGRLEAAAGQATYYPALGGGACSLPMVAGGFYTAMSELDWAGSEVCGRCLRVTGPEGEVTVLVTDQCPGTECGSGDLDLSPAAFDAIADPLDGIAPISWESVACDVGGEPMKLEFEGSHEWYLKVQVQDHRHGIASLDLRQGDQWLSMERSNDDHFVRTGDGPYAEPFAFRVEDVHGQVVETDAVALANDVPLDAGVQLAPCPEPDGALAGFAALAALGGAARRFGAA